jgi:hypothetical protein
LGSNCTIFDSMSNHTKDGFSWTPSPCGFGSKETCSQNRMTVVVKYGMQPERYKKDSGAVRI